VALRVLEQVMPQLATLTSGAAERMRGGSRLGAAVLGMARRIQPAAGKAVKAAPDDKAAAAETDHADGRQRGPEQAG
jgi:hypothetical protein